MDVTAMIWSLMTPTSTGREPLETEGGEGRGTFSWSGDPGDRTVEIFRGPQGRPGGKSAPHRPRTARRTRARASAAGQRNRAAGAGPVDREDISLPGHSSAAAGAGHGRPFPGAARGKRGRGTRKRLGAVLLAGVLLSAAAARAGDVPTAATTADRGENLRRSRLEFDERLIMGQSLKSGAIYLFNRKDSQLQSMVKIRKDFREELLSPLEPSP